MLFRSRRTHRLHRCISIRSSSTNRHQSSSSRDVVPERAGEQADCSVAGLLPPVFKAPFASHFAPCSYPRSVIHALLLPAPKQFVPPPFQSPDFDSLGVESSSGKQGERALEAGKEAGDLGPVVLFPLPRISSRLAVSPSTAHLASPPPRQSPDSSSRAGRRIARPRSSHASMTRS